MPIYEYHCNFCQHMEEILQKVNEPPPPVCPTCGKKATLKKQISHTSFQLKGGGWYSDLYASAKTEKKTQSEPKPKAESAPVSKSEKST